MVVFPGYVFLIAFYLRKNSFKESLKLISPYVAIVVVLIVFRLCIKSPAAGVPGLLKFPQVDFFTYTSSFSRLIFWYLTKLIVPRGIVLIWGITPVKEGVILNNLFLIGLVLSVAYLIKRWHRDLKSFALLWFLSGFLPVGILCFIYPSIGLIIEPHWFFVSSVGGFLLLSEGLEKLPNHLPKIWQTAIIVGLIFFLGFTSIGYTRLWKDQKTYCRYWISLVPQHRRINFWLGSEYLKERNYEQAQWYFKQALVNGFNDWQVYSNLGSIEYGQKNFELAINYFKKALNLNPDSGLIFYDLGLIYRDQNEQKKAEEAFRKAIMLDPYLLPSRLNLAWMYRSQNKIKEAIGLCEENLRIDERDEACSLAVIEMNLFIKDQQRAVKLAEGILAKNHNPAFLTAVGDLFSYYHFPDVALTFYSKAIEISPQYKPAYLKARQLSKIKND